MTAAHTVMPQAALPTRPPGQLYAKHTLVAGRPATVQCITLADRTFVVEGGPLAVIRLEEEWFDDVGDPQAVIEAIAGCGVKADLFSFWQRLPDVRPRYPFGFDREEIAALPIVSHDHWWRHQIKSRVRNQIRKAEKDGLVVREVPFDDDFVRGMTAIFNEAPLRQGRPFWHYGKDFDTVKQQFSRFLFRERMIGAYRGGQMVGFMMLGISDRYAITGQIISSLHHRDLSPSNALIGKAVEVCAASGLGHLVYLHWSDDSLGEFKRRCGFEKVPVPRYHVALTWKGRLALRIGAARGWKGMLPPRLAASLKQARAAWYEWRAR